MRDRSPEALLLLVAAGLLLGACRPARNAGATAAGGLACAGDNGGITLPAGFCATVFADSVGGARHITVAANGDVFVALNGSGPSVVALRDENRDGHADVKQYFGDVSGDRGEQFAGIQMRDTLLYVDAVTAIVRYRVPRASLRPAGSPDTIVMDLPTGGHGARNFTLDPTGTTLFVNVGSQTNSCQVRDRSLESPGHDPCAELETRAGIWQFSAHRLHQRQRDGVRFATGIRNAMGLAVNPVNGLVYATQHGRDQLAQNWPKLFTVEQSAENPAEELLQVNRGDDFGWPYCFYGVDRKARVLAPEYGGDGTAIGRCAAKKQPIAIFPGHWAPMSLVFYEGTQFPARYREGAFVAFHGSWNRAPLPQAGYRVAFVPMANGRPSGGFETFADGFPGVDLAVGAYHRPVGLAQAPDGSLFITDDAGGRIWRVGYSGAGR